MQLEFSPCVTENRSFQAHLRQLMRPGSKKSTDKRPKMFRSTDRAAASKQILLDALNFALLSSMLLSLFQHMSEEQMLDIPRHLLHFSVFLVLGLTLAFILLRLQVLS